MPLLIQFASDCFDILRIVPFSLFVCSSFSHLHLINSSRHKNFMMHSPHILPNLSMDGLNSAEAVTRFLRGKDSSPENVCNVVQALLSGGIPVYLPNSTRFVFELVCDRLNDFNGKNFKLWKLHPGIWDLLSRLWTAMGVNEADREDRTRSFRRVKVVAIITSVLNSLASKYEEKLLQSMFLCVELIMATGYVDVDEFTGVGLLKSYSSLVNFIDNDTIDKSPFDHWSKIISRLLELPRKSATFKPSKKAAARFFVEPLPVILNILAHRKNDELTSTYAMLKEQLEVSVFGEESPLSSQIVSIASSEDLSAEGAEYLFQETITHLASGDIALCETVYVKITNHFTSLAEKLLGVLSRINRTLSSSFFGEIFISEMAKSKQNWRLIGYLLHLDPELAISKWEDAVQATTKISADESFALADNLAHGFIRARDFSQFMRQVYPAGIKNSANVWQDDQMIEILAPKVNELSGNQISALIRHFMDAGDKLSLSILLHGLLFCPLAKQKMLENLFQDYNFCQKGWSEVAYLVLCIYGQSILDVQTDILEKVGSGFSKYDVYLKLRVAELSGDLSLVDAKEATKLITKLDARNLLLFAQRWLVILDSFPDIHAELFKKMLELLSKLQMLSFFQGQSDIIYELPQFMRGFLKALRLISISYRDELFCCFPAIVFRKYFNYYIHLISEEAIADPDNIIARETLKHILQEPSLSSNIERDLGKLRTLLNSSKPETTEVSMDIARSIWSSHLHNIKDSNSSTYVVDALKTLVKAMKKPSNGDFALVQVILSIPTVKGIEEIQKLYQELCYKFVTAVRKLKMPIEEQMVALSEIPLEVSEEVRSAIKELTKEIGSQASTTSTQIRLFALVVKSSSLNISNAFFITSLFVAICLNECEDDKIQFMLKQLNHYYKELSNDNFMEIYRHVLHTLEDAPASYIPYLIDILSLLAPMLKKAHQQEHSQLFVATLLTVALQKRLADHALPLIRFLSAITLMLSDHIWICTQYSVELIISFGDLIASDLDNIDSSEKIYIAVIQMESYVVLFHRYRLTSRYHLIIGVCSRLMVPLASGNPLEDSKPAAAAYARLLTTLSEPQVLAYTKESDSLTSQAAASKKLLRKHAHILVVNYVHLQLTHALVSAVNEAVLPGVYSVLGLLSRVEMQLVNQCLDSLGQTYFKSLYGGYRDHGKWRDQ